MKTKLLITCLLFAPLLSWGVDMISPINFNPTSTNKNKVISFIKYNVKETYSRIGMDSESTILMMYNEEVKASRKNLEW